MSLTKETWDKILIEAQPVLGTAIDIILKSQGLAGRSIVENIEKFLGKIQSAVIDGESQAEVVEDQAVS